MNHAQLTGRNLAVLLTVGICCLTAIGVVAMLTGVDGVLLASVVGGIAAVLGVGTGRLTLR